MPRWPSTRGASGGSGPALADLARAAPASGRWADLRLRVLSAAILAPAALLCVWAGGWVYGVMLVAGFVGVAWEWGSMCRWRRLPLWAGLLYAALALGALWDLRTIGGAGLTFMLLAIVWCSDVGAYAVGRLAGGPRLAPRVSPGKTWSGAAGGLVAAMIGGSVVAGVSVVDLGPTPMVLGFSAALGIASQLGDLGESALKRHYGVKDSGRLLPGHGGLLDRLDGLLAAAIAGGVIVLACAVLWS